MKRLTKDFALFITWAAALACIIAYCHPAQAQPQTMRGWLIEDQIKQIRLELGPRYAGDYRWYVATCEGKICTYKPRFDLQYCRGYLNCREAAQHGEHQR